MSYNFQAEAMRYHQIPKDFVGPSEADALFSTYRRLSRAEDKPGHLFTAGSAAAEAGLMATNASTQERHARLHSADTIWQKAQEAFIDRHIDDGWSESRLLSIPDRIEMSRIFVPLYHDLVDGCVRETTIEKTHQRLIRLGLDNSRRHDQSCLANDSGGISLRRGLGYELGTMMTVTRLHCPSFFAIPATDRADHGGYYREETHDVRLIHQSWGKIISCVPYEIKPYTKNHTNRYKSALIAGRIQLQMPSSTSPLELASYMDKENRGLISEKDLEELNAITSSVLTEAISYKNKLSIGQKALAVA